MAMSQNRSAARDFGRWLDLTMTNADMTGKELAERASLDEAQISRWRHGRGRPAIDSCGRLADALGVDKLRLAVTAGVIDQDMAGVEPLPVPPNTVLVEKVRKRLVELPGATEQSVKEMLAAFRRGIEEE